MPTVSLPRASNASAVRFPSLSYLGMSPAALRWLALTGPPLVVLLLGLLLFDGQRRHTESASRVEAAHSALLELRAIHARLLGAEAAARGYLVTGEEAFLEPHRRARAEIAAMLERAGRLVDPGNGGAELAPLRSVVGARLDHADELAALRQRGPIPDELAAAAVSRGKGLMDRAVGEIERIEAMQRARLHGYAANHEARRRATLLLVALGTVASGALTLLLNALLASYSRRLEAGARELAESNEVLEQQAVELESQAAELEEAAEALRAHDAYLAAVIDTDPNVICVKDAEGRIRLANRATADLLGLPPELVVGRLDTEVYPFADDVAHFREEDRTVLATGQQFVIDEQAIVVPGSGEVRWFAKWKAPLTPPDGGPPQVLAVALDITERLRAQEALRRSETVIEQTQHEILMRLSQAAEFRDDETGRHTRRVAALAAEISRLLGLDPRDVEMIERAAPLHDVGKIGIPDAILLKPGRLTAAEFAVMKSHTVIGAKLLSGRSSELMALAEQVAIAHHERWDGAGYPHALREDDIPVAARIVCVADVVDALAHDRPYRSAWEIPRVEEEIRAQRGRMFDPRLVECCLEVLNTPGARSRWLEA